MKFKLFLLFIASCLIYGIDCTLTNYFYNISVDQAFTVRKKREDKSSILFNLIFVNNFDMFDLIFVRFVFLLIFLNSKIVRKFLFSYVRIKLMI